MLHLLAMAHEAEVSLELDDFTEIGKRVPVLCDLKPSGKYNMSHFVRIGGLRPLLKTLLEQGLLHGECVTVLGKTLAENVADAKPYAPYPNGQDLVRPFENPIKKDSHLRILYGSLAADGAVAKITGKGLKFSGTAIVYESEETAPWHTRWRSKIWECDRNPQRRTSWWTWHREMLSPTSAIMGKGLGRSCLDYRWPLFREEVTGLLSGMLLQKLRGRAYWSANQW